MGEKFMLITVRCTRVSFLGVVVFTELINDYYVITGRFERNWSGIGGVLFEEWVRDRGCCSQAGDA